MTTYQTLRQYITFKYKIQKREASITREPYKTFRFDSSEQLIVCYIVASFDNLSYTSFEPWWVASDRLALQGSRLHTSKNVQCKDLYLPIISPSIVYDSITQKYMYNPPKENQPKWKLLQLYKSKLHLLIDACTFWVYQMDFKLVYSNTMKVMCISWRSDMA